MCVHYYVYAEIKVGNRWYNLKQKRLYSFYRWNEPYDEYSAYRVIYERLNALLYWFDYADAFEDKSEYWHSDAGLEDIRLFIEKN